MIGFSLTPSPPKAALTVAGKFGKFLQDVADDLRSMTSQVFVVGLNPPQMRSLEKPWSKMKNTGLVRLG